MNTYDGLERMSLPTWQMAFKTKLASLESSEPSMAQTFPSQKLHSIETVT